MPFECLLLSIAAPTEHDLDLDVETFTVLGLVHDSVAEKEAALGAAVQLPLIHLLYLQHLGQVFFYATAELTHALAKEVRAVGFVIVPSIEVAMVVVGVGGSALEIGRVAVECLRFQGIKKGNIIR